MNTLEDVSSVASFINVYEVSIKPRLPFSIISLMFMKSQSNRDSHFLSVMWSLFPKAIF